MASRSDEVQGTDPSVQETQDQALRAICAVLAQRTGNDFSQYKPGTLNRRIHRRMLANGIQTHPEYLALLEDSQEEVSSLLGDLLIGVTEFFRDPQAFEALLGYLMQELGAHPETPLRIWVPGCASGEEAYSLGILVQEGLEALGSGRRVQIFATDIDPAALMLAKAGRYSEEALGNLGPDRRRRFFTEGPEGWQVSKALREMCVFSLQNLLRDPPFSSLHLISCRNVFIYLQPSLQGKLIPLFHFALKSGGLLFLGRSEGLAAQPMLFDPLDKFNRIFRRREVARPPLEFPAGDRRVRRKGIAPMAGDGPETGAPFAALGHFEQMLMKDYLPASAIVNELGDILLWAGQIGRFLNLAPGVPSSNLLANVSGPLHWELRRLLAKTAAERGGANQAVVHSDSGHGLERLRLTVRPMPGMERGAMVFAVVIQTEGPADTLAVPSVPSEADSPLLEQLNLELLSTRGELKTAVEELEAANEELKSSNEELQSSNEELQGSEEELRSVNEELTTLNQELGQKIGALNEANSDLQNLMASTEIPTLFLDRTLSVSRFTPAATKLFGLIEADLGRPIRDLSPRFTGIDLPALAETVLATRSVTEAHARSLVGERWFIVRLHPYRTPDDQVRGVVVTFVDCTEVRWAQMVATESEARYRRLFECMVNGFAHCRMRFEGDRPVDFQYLAVNEAFQTQTGLRDVVGRWVSEVIPGIREQDPGLFEAYGRVARTGRPERFEIRVAALGDWFDISVYSPRNDEFVAVFDVVTSRKQAEEALIRSEEQFRSLFETVPDGVVYQEANGAVTAANPAAESILGLTLEEMQGKNPAVSGWQAFAADGSPLPSDLLPAMVALRSGKPLKDQTIGVRNPRKGEITWISVNAVPQSRPGESSPSRVYATFKDITEARRMEQELQVLHADLERRVAERTTQLQAANRELEAFSYSVSHDLRAPLRAIDGFSHILGEEFGDRLDEEGRRYLHRVRKGTQRMGQLIDDLLKLSQISRVDLVCQPLDLSAQAIQILESLEAGEPGRTVRTVVAPGLKATGDPRLVALALDNLLGNAWKYTARNPDAWLEFGLTSRNGGQVFFVRDNGAGFDMRYADKLFGPFQRLHSAEEYEGSGVGLAIVKRVIDRHGGRIWAESEPGKGAAFFFSLA